MKGVLREFKTNVKYASDENFVVMTRGRMSESISSVGSEYSEIFILLSIIVLV